MTDYQKIRASIEAPILVAFNNQAPPVPVYFDNITAISPDPSKEYVRVNLTFGAMDESSLAGSIDHPRGALVVRCFATKGGGPARCQELVSIAVDVVKNLARTSKQDSKTFVRTSKISGPTFYGETIESVEGSYSNQMPHFMGKVTASWQAFLPCSD